MKVFAVYNIKGGVGKTAAAVNLSFLASTKGYPTLIWDLDAQGAATFYFRVKAKIKGGSERLLHKKRGLAGAIRETDYSNLDLVPADFSLRNLDLDLHDHRKSTQRLRKLLKTVRDDYELVFLDCAPSLSVVSENVFNMADWLLVPLIPTHLSLRAYEQLLSYRHKNKAAGARLLPFFSMVDKRKRLHRDLVNGFAGDHPELLRSYIPYASDIERMGEYRSPVHAFAPQTAGARAFSALWHSICQRTIMDPGSFDD
jgi:cellulose biosynthesis protein BcsQ